MSTATDHRSTDTATSAPALLANTAGDYRVRPPIAGGEVELEARGARANIIVATRDRGAARPS